MRLNTPSTGDDQHESVGRCDTAVEYPLKRRRIERSVCPDHNDVVVWGCVIPRRDQRARCFHTGHRIGIRARPTVRRPANRRRLLGLPIRCANGPDRRRGRTPSSRWWMVTTHSPSVRGRAPDVRSVRVRSPVPWSRRQTRAAGRTHALSRCPGTEEPEQPWDVRARGSCPTIEPPEEFVPPQHRVGSILDPVTLVLVVHQP